jgi:hypothetical protein
MVIHGDPVIKSIQNHRDSTDVLRQRGDGLLAQFLTTVVE